MSDKGKGSKKRENKCKTICFEVHHSFIKTNHSWVPDAFTVFQTSKCLGEEALFASSSHFLSFIGHGWPTRVLTFLNFWLV